MKAESRDRSADVGGSYNYLGCGALLVLLALEAAEITTGRAAELLGTDIVSVRELLAKSIANGVKIATVERARVDTRCTLLAADRRPMSSD